MVGAFLGLTWARSNARRFPAIDPLISWSKYLDQMKEHLDRIDPQWVAGIKKARQILFAGDEIKKRMDVIGEEGTSLSDFMTYLKAEFLDAVFLQQNAFDQVDAANSIERQIHVFARVLRLMEKDIPATDKDNARNRFFDLTALYRNWNSSPGRAGSSKNTKTRSIPFWRSEPCGRSSHG